MIIVFWVSCLVLLLTIESNYFHDTTFSPLFLRNQCTISQGIKERVSSCKWKSGAWSRPGRIIPGMPIPLSAIGRRNVINFWQSLSETNLLVTRFKEQLITQRFAWSVKENQKSTTRRGFFNNTHWFMHLLSLEPKSYFMGTFLEAGYQ